MNEMPIGKIFGAESRGHDQIGKTRQVGEIAAAGRGAARRIRRRVDALRPARGRRIDDRLDVVGLEDAVEDRAHERQRVIAHRRVLIIVERAAGRFADHQRPPRRIRAGAVRARRVDLARALDQLGDVLRILRPERLQVVGDLDDELGIANRVVILALGIEQPLRQADVDDRRALLAHRFERRLHHPVDVGVLSEEIARDAQARALERVGLECLRVIGGASALARFRRDIRGIDAGDHAQHRGDIVDVPGHRPNRVEAQRERNHAVAAHQAHRRLEAGDAVRRRGTAHRTAGVRAKSGHGERSGNRRAGAARGSGRRSREVVRIEDLSAERAMRGAGREFRQVHLRDDHRARRAQLLDDERIIRGDRSFEEHRSAGGRQIGGIDVVFQHDRNAVQRGARSLGLALLVHARARFRSPSD